MKDAGLDSTSRTERPRPNGKRLYSSREVAEFGSDGTPWPSMYEAALANIERGTFNGVALLDVRRMGELAGMSNRKIGAGLARAIARSRCKVN
jgi:hypothetical protein